MPADLKMTINERRKYLGIMFLQYARATREERSHLLDQMEAVTTLDSKTLIRLLKGDLTRHPRQTQRSRTYGADVDDALRIIADSFDHPCAERLTPNLCWMATHLALHGELTTSPALLTKLDTISIPTVRRILSRVTQDVPKLPRPTPRSANAALRDIPMTQIPWDTQEPGHFEADLVHHCGPSADGQYMHTLQLIDVATGWSERVATLGRSYTRIEEGFGRILARLPFPIRELHPDNGNEFFNSYLLEFWKDKVKQARLTRSRPYHKNDNRFVEQRNSSEVRAYFGTQRLDTTVHTVAANRLYDKLWVYYNLFRPVLRLTEKTVITREGEPARVKLKHDDAKTPFDRLCKAKALSTETQEELERLRDRTNPRRLKQEIYNLLDYILDLPCANETDS